MKKVLFATTALVLSAGFASAEIAVVGSANVGAKYVEGAAQSVTAHYEIDFGLNGSVETDSGLTFGASIDLDTDVANAGSFTSSDGEVFVSGAFGTLTVGKVDAADDQYFGALEVGFDGIGLDDVAENGYGGGAADVLYTYSVGALSVAGAFSSSNADDSYSLGVQYKGPVTVALGYNDDGSNTVTSLGITGSAGAIGYKVAFTDNQANGQGYGLGGTYKVSDALTLQAGFADSDASTDASYAAGFTYDLGGATLAGGVGSINGTAKADLGVNFSF